MGCCSNYNQASVLTPVVELGGNAVYGVSLVFSRLDGSVVIRVRVSAAVLQNSIRYECLARPCDGLRQTRIHPPCSCSCSKKCLTNAVFWLGNGISTLSTAELYNSASRESHLCTPDEHAINLSTRTQHGIRARMLLSVIMRSDGLKGLALRGRCANVRSGRTGARRWVPEARHDRRILALGQFCRPYFGVLFKFTVSYYRHSWHLSFDVLYIYIFSFVNLPGGTKICRLIRASAGCMF